MSRFYSDFKNPPSEFYPVPWWAWKGEMEFPEMLRQLDLMQQQGVKEFFIFAASRLAKPVFLSDEWFEYVTFTLEEAQKRDMKVWIYDDLSWPSGAAGGYAVKDHPEMREFCITCRTNRIIAGEFVYVDQADLLQCLWQDASGVIKPVQADEYSCFTNTGDQDGVLVRVYKMPCEAMLLNTTSNAYCWGQRGQIAWLDKKIFKVWMQYVHEEYEKRYKKYFGNLIKGFFIDEPQLHEFTGNSAPYNPVLTEAFIKKYNYDPTEHFHKLFLNVEGSEAFRRDYMSVAAELFSDNMLMLREWCDERDLLLTGHAVWEEVISNMQSYIFRNGDAHKVIKQFHIPGCDLLGHIVPYLKPGTGLHINNTSGLSSIIYTAKYVSSTARWSKARRTICEAFGTRNYHSGVAGQKLISDFLAAMGINIINDNTLAYTSSEASNSGKSFSVPWWHLYKNFYDCAARLSLFAAFGHAAAKIAVMMPISTAWSKTRAIDGADFAENAAVFNRVSMQLLRNRIEFEYVFEDTPDADELKAFDFVILPMMEFMPPEVAVRLDKFRQNGGKVIAIKCQNKLTDNSGIYQADIYAEKLDEVLDMLPQPVFRLTGEKSEDILSALRVENNEYLLLLANQTAGSKVVQFEHEFAASGELCDPDSGMIYALDGKVLTLAENQSVILRFAPESQVESLQSAKNCVTLKSDCEKTIMTLDGAWAFDFGKFNGVIPPVELRFDPGNVGVAQEWFKNPPAEWYQCAKERMPFNVHPRECMYYWLRGSFELEKAPDVLALVFDNPAVREVYVNGVKAPEVEKFDLLDHLNRRCDISDLCRKGHNEYYVRFAVSRWNEPELKLSGSRNEVRAPAVCGNFAERADGVLIDPPETVETNSWSQYGLARLPRYGVYKKSFELDNIPQHPVLDIENANSTVEVELNGKMLTPRCWAPYRFDLAGALQKGENHITIKVAGGFGNLFNRGGWGRLPESTLVDYGILGKVQIVERTL